MAESSVAVAEAHDKEELTCQLFRRGKPAGHIDVAQVNEVLKEEGVLVWLDVVNPGPRDLDTLQEEFDLHPLAVEDAVQAHERPKIEAYGRYWFLVVLATTLAGDDIVFHEIDIFAGQKFLVTVRHTPAFPLDDVVERWQVHPERLRHGGGFLLYTILDTVVDGYLPVAVKFEDRVDALEEVLFQRRVVEQDVLRQIFDMKKSAQAFRHAVLPMRDILNPIIRGDLTLFPEEEIVYYRDVYDHAVRVIDQLDSVRDLVNSALEIHVSVVGNRQNEIAKQLTFIATIFLPLTFITGFFGQNFGLLVSHITGATAFWSFGIGLEVLTVVITIAYFRLKGWF